MKHTDSILQQLYMSKLPKAQKGFSMLDLIRQTSNEDRSRGDMQTYFPQIAKIKQKPIMDEAIAKAQQIRKQKLAEELSRKAIANQPTLSQAKPDYRTNREKAAQRNEMARAEALQNSPLAQTFGSFTPGGYNPGAGAIGAETFVNMNPLITGPVLSGTRLIGQLKGNNPYGFGESTLGNVMGGIGLLGDALFLKGTAPAGTASQVGKYITTQTPVRNAWKLNPRSFNLPKQIAKENTPVRQIYGDEALESFKQYGPSTQPDVSQYDQFMQFAKMKGDNVLHSGTGETMNIASLGNKYPYPYFSQGSKWYGPNSTMKQLGTERIIVPKQGADLTFYPAGENSVLKNFDDLSQQTIDSYAGRRRILAPFEGFDNPSNFNLYEGKPHWWKGYRKVDIPESPTITSGVDDLGIYSQAGDKKYYTLGEGFGDLGSSEQQKAKFINKLSDTEFTDYLSKLSNAEKRKLYGLPAYDIDKSLLNQSKNQLLQLQKSGADYIHPFIRNTSWRNLGDEFRGIMKKWGLEPTNQKDVEKFRKLYINDQFNMLLNSKPMSFGDKATYINNPITLNKDGGPIVDPRGQWAHPGKVTRIPGSDITMQGVNYPVYGVGSNGQEQMMYPGQNYDFGEASYVDEYPMMQYGGQSTTGYSNLFPNHNDFLRRLEVFDYVKQQHNQGLDFHTKWLNSPMYNSMINASDPINAKQITDQRKKRLSAIDFKYVDKPYGKAGASSDKLGNIEIYPLGIGQKGVGVHEMSHVTDTGPGQNLIPAKDRIDITRYSLASKNIPKYEAYKEYFNYVTEPSETRARLNEIRQGASENKLYDPFTQKVSPAIYNKLKNFKFNSNPGNDPLQQLRSAFSDDQILQMLNSVSQNNTQQDMMYAEQGGQMIRRADGSYSRRGLWDNIRANKGSGKKPTKEMLEQERKIKAKEMKYGGINNAGFDALPDYVQANIISNMAYGGMAYPFMQQGGEPDGEMAIGQINAAMDKLAKLRQFIQPDSDLEPWVSSKLTMLDHYTDAVSDYMMYNPEAEDMQGLPMQEMKNGGGVPERYKNMGFTKVGVKKNSTRPGKKWMVLAKKGDQYKVVHGGYDGMKDFSQHGSEKRKENFWNRMGGKSSSKATDPFSPLYWHKRFGTWEDGGEIPQMKGGGSTFSGNAWYEMGGQPCYECGGDIYQWGGAPKTIEERSIGDKCGIQKGINKELAANNAAASRDAAMWAKQAERNEKILAKEEAAKLAGELNFDYDWTGYPVEKAEKKAAMAQYKQFFQQNPNTFVADDTSGFNPEQKYIIASKLKQKISTPVFGKNFQQQYGVDPRALDLQRLQSEMAPRMGGWEGMRNYLFNKKKYGGPAVGAEMDVTPEQLEALRQQGYEFEII